MPSIASSLVALAALLGADGPAPLAPSFEATVAPILRARCAACHGDKRRNGGVDFSKLGDEGSLRGARKLWRSALAQVEAGEMPPDGQAPLDGPSRAFLIGWLRRAADPLSVPPTGDPGPMPPRRLSVDEYRRTISDLLGIDVDPAAAGLVDERDEANRYGNLASALAVSPALLEKLDAAAEMALDRLLGVELSSTVDGEIAERARRSRERLFGLKPDAWRKPDAPEGLDDGPEAARALLAKFLRRAHRRPVAPAEVDAAMRLHDRVGGHLPGIRLAMKATLVSPAFLFRVEPRVGEGIQPVGDHAMAVRLSYLLWSTMPDAALDAAADAGKLRGGPDLDAQVARMLADPRARALTDEFAASWLQFRRLPTARPSTEFFPDFNAEVRDAMAAEAAAFFDGLRREDRSLLELIDADYTYLNEDLSKYYKIPGVAGKEIRRVVLPPGSPRGGVLGMGAILASTSATARTSPTLRGKWVLEALLGTPPPPPPANASQLKVEARPGEAPKTFREQMAMHAAEPACAACHRRMDPLGYALEAFDAAGTWRADDRGKPVDDAGELPDGRAIRGVAGLKRILMDQKAAFTRNLVEQMFIYALGRELEAEDDRAVELVARRLEADGYKFSTLVRGVVASVPFSMQRGADE